MKQFAVFDIDGTLIRWQLYHAVVDRLAKKQLLGTDATEKLHQARMKWKRRESADSFRTYEKSLIEIFEAAFGSLTTSDFDNAVSEIIQEYSAQTYVYTRDLTRQLKSKGYLLLAISGSHHELVKHIAKQYGFDDCVGSTYEREGEHFSGKVFIASQDKRQVLQQLITKHQLTLTGSIAIGDSASDAAMLEMVEQPIAFNPDQNLYQIARQKAWKIVVERKNVVYELEAGDGHYILA